MLFYGAKNKIIFYIKITPCIKMGSMWPGMKAAIRLLFLSSPFFKPLYQQISEISFCIV